MPSLSGRHDGRRILLPVAILRSEDPTDLTHEVGVALLDTGATSSAIAPAIVTKLGLVSSGKRPIMVATEQRLVDFFVFRLGLFPEVESAPAPLGLPYVFAETEGFQIRQTHGFDVLLGMDVLRECDFSLARKRTWALAFG